MGVASRAMFSDMTAGRKLEPAPAAFAAEDDDGPLYSFDDAPLAAELETEEERAAVEEAWADGRYRRVDEAEVRAILERVRRAEQTGWTG
jgi:hypothetical protein